MRVVSYTQPRILNDACQTYLGLLRLLVLLLRLSLGNGRQPLLLAGLSSLVALGGDGGEVGTDDTTLMLHGLARALLGDLLCDTLLVHATVELCPGDLAGVLALEEEGLILRGGEAEDLGCSNGMSWVVREESIGETRRRTLLSPRTKRRPLEG